MPASRWESLAGRQDLPSCLCSPSGGHKTIYVSEDWRGLDFFSFPFYSSAFGYALLLLLLRHSLESSGGNSPPQSGCGSARNASHTLMCTHFELVKEQLSKAGGVELQHLPPGLR